MNGDPKKWVLLNLADQVEVLHLALEGKNLTNPDERMIYLGHLAQCARLFKVIYLDQPASEIKVIFDIESMSYGIATPNNERGLIVKEAWDVFSPILLSFIDSRMATT